MKIKTKHEMQERIMAYHVMNSQSVGAHNARQLCAMWMRRVRKLRDADLVRIARTIPA